MCKASFSAHSNSVDGEHHTRGLNCAGALAADGRGVPAFQEVPDAAPPPAAQRRALTARSPESGMCAYTPSILVWPLFRARAGTLSQDLASMCSHAAAELKSWQATAMADGACMMKQVRLPCRSRRAASSASWWTRRCRACGRRTARPANARSAVSAPSTSSTGWTVRPRPQQPCLLVLGMSRKP